jgi:hypothetical protein
MNKTLFCDKKSLIINSPNIRNEIKTFINKIGNFNLTSKYYTFLNKKNVNNLKESNFLVSLNTFGKKFILFITTCNSKKLCIFINKKNDTMTITQLHFTNDIFLGTLFDGELVKNSNNKWIYIINDIAYYKGENIITKTFNERQKIINNILTNDHDNNFDNGNQTLYISKKIYFEYNNINDLINNYSKHLNYKCSGLYFKNTKNFSDNYLFIFPECRSDSNILNNGYAEKKKESEDLEDSEDSLFKNVDVIHTHNQNQNQTQNQSETQTQKKQPLKLEKTTCRFLLNPTIMPDIYELYCANSNNNIDKYSYASVPDIDTSNFLKSIVYDNYDYSEDIKSKFDNKKAIFVECNYHKSFKKWIPYKKVDNMDTINTINQIQIILDSL